MSRAMTQGKLARLLAAGYGAGRDEGYQAWIRVRRKLREGLHKAVRDKIAS